MEKNMENEIETVFLVCISGLIGVILGNWKRKWKLV